jgi:hypothetical protein
MQDLGFFLHHIIFSDGELAGKSWAGGKYASEALGLTHNIEIPA